MISFCQIEERPDKLYKEMPDFFYNAFVDKIIKLYFLSFQRKKSEVW